MKQLFSQDFKTSRILVRSESKNFSRLLLLTVLMFWLPQNSVAQRSLTNDHFELPTLNQFTASLPAHGAEINRLISLLNELHSSIYLRSGEVKNYGAQPVCLFADVNSWSLSNSLTPSQCDSIEIITLKITSASDFDGGISTSSFSAFPNLRYLYIVSEIETTPRKITNLVVGPKPSIAIFYNILQAK